ARWFSHPKTGKAVAWSGNGESCALRNASQLLGHGELVGIDLDHLTRRVDINYDQSTAHVRADGKHNFFTQLDPIALLDADLHAPLWGWGCFLGLPYPLLRKRVGGGGCGARCLGVGGFYPFWGCKSSNPRGVTGPTRVDAVVLGPATPCSPAHHADLIRTAT